MKHLIPAVESTPSIGHQPKRNAGSLELTTVLLEIIMSLYIREPLIGN